MLEGLLTAWIVACGAHELVLGRSPGLIVAGDLAAGELTTRWLWRHHHRRYAIAVTAIGVVAHGWAATHNLGVR
jgi:hypothetical protein